MRAELYELHAEHERSHWWYAARRAIVLDVLRRETAGRSGLRIADIGCGAGGLLPHLETFGSVTGVDGSPEAVRLAGSHGADVRLGSLPDALPFTDERFDVITLLDVIEHIDDDAGALRAVRRLLAPGGLALITVPAFPFLWSAHDVVNEHRRRYTRGSLAAVLGNAGFDVALLSYYNTVLFPPIAGLRLARRLVGGERARPDVGALPRPLNAVLTSLFAAERYLLRRLSLPFGVSLIATARATRGPEPRHEDAR